MIIKFYGYGQTNMFDEVDSLRYEKVPEKEPVVVPDNCLDFTGIPAGEESLPRPEFKHKLWIMNKNQTAETQILAYGPIYLMNNNGKTIEVL